MRIAVFGCGGVGAYFGGRLAQIGQDVTFIARNENFSALRSNGLKVVRSRYRRLLAVLR
jgi:2-dehydropantoate 2-reductase